MSDRDRHAGQRFALFTPPPEDPDFARVRDHLFSVVDQAAWQLRRRCAEAHGITVFDTRIDIIPDPDRPNFITLTAYPRVVVEDERP